MKTTLQFKHGQRVRVIRDKTGLVGKVGTVIRILYSDPHMAWIWMDEPLPFPIFDDEDKRNFIMLCDEDCVSV